MMRDLSSNTGTHGKAWLRAAANREHDLNDVYITLTDYGSCLVSMDPARLHLDWRPNTPDHADLPVQYVLAVQNLLRHIGGMQACLLLIEPEFNRVWEHYVRHEQTAPDQPFVYDLPTPSFLDHMLPRLRVNGTHWLEALGGFQEPVQFWYHPNHPDTSPIAIGTPGVRLAMLMPVKGNA
jgi:hypothetical protein